MKRRTDWCHVPDIGIASAGETESFFQPKTLAGFENHLAYSCGKIPTGEVKLTGLRGSRKILVQKKLSKLQRGIRGTHL